ncbi:hypothetical protein NKDENANG_03858 [Candidatus Entotheonellaceae bacterium PAL068K]
MQGRARYGLWGLLLLLNLSGCGAAYRFQYHYTMISPPGGTEGIEDNQVHIQLAPAPQTGVMQVNIANKGSGSIAIVWQQTHYIDPFGRRRQATETGMHWFFRLREWFADETRIAPGEMLSTHVQPGSRQSYNPFVVSRVAGGDVTLSTSSHPLLPASGNTPNLGKSYKGQKFQFILTLRIGTSMTQYPFAFRITDVEVQ